MPEGNQPRAGILGWFAGEKAVPANAISDEPVERLQELPKRQDRSRKDSSSLTHDEALNISRANSTRSQEVVAGSPLSPKLPPPQRGRSNSKFEKLGLMAAYSAGPSSF